MKKIRFEINETEEELEFWKEAFTLAAKKEMKELDERLADQEPCVYSDKFKRKMNRVFREIGGSKRIPHPEVDNMFERIRSGIVCAVKFK